ncbi:hypothetical protein WR25_19503 [Diploscapter pachys]|uniref:Methyltransferase type 11 domain-containing protein n=1 Tax=Diploscapter pachys TaxID=2018661 RepID=A0A2A2K0P8_9BILA|nr:hypothetical protein WR25_19503 [Diploscapter pachys]
MLFIDVFIEFFASIYYNLFDKLILYPMMAYVAPKIGVFFMNLGYMPLENRSRRNHVNDPNDDVLVNVVETNADPNVLNIESSHLYPDCSAFFSEVHRVLRIGGHFCWADLRFADQISEVTQQAREAGLTLVHWIDVTENIVAGIHRSAAYYDTLLERAPWIVRLFRYSIRRTYCAPGTVTYHRLVSRRRLYFVFKHSLGLTYAQAPPTNCDAFKFVKCQERFGADMGINGTVYNWQNPMGLALQIQNIYIDGTTLNPLQKGIVSVCNAYNDFIQCLHDNAFTAFECFDPRFLITADASPGQAYSYAFLINMIQYQCGAGFYLASDNWDCMKSYYGGKNGTLIGCLNDFVVNTVNDPTNACNYLQTGMNCFSNSITGSRCPDEMRYYACESFRQFAYPKFGSICVAQTCQVNRFRASEDDF